MMLDPVSDSADLLRLAAESSPHLLSKHSRDGRFLFVAGSSDRLLGYPPDALVGQQVLDFVHPADVAKVERALAITRAQSTLQCIAYRLRKKDGGFRWMETIFKPVPNGSAVQELLGYSHDISQEMYLEEALRIMARGTDAAHGLDFFRMFISQVAAALRMPFAFVTEHTHDKSRVRMLAFWQGQDFGSPFEYGLSGTPCDDVINQGKTCYYPVGVQARFPHDKDLVSLSAQGYVGVPIADSTGAVIGHLAVLDSKPMLVEDRELSILRVFALRAGVELERLQRERDQAA